MDTHWQRGLSYFQIGWRWLKHILANSKILRPCFWLEPGPDPYPVYASKRQAGKPTVILYGIRLEIT